MSKQNYLEKLILDNEVEKLDELLSRKESFNNLIKLEFNGKSALHIALLNNKFEIVNLFARHGVLHKSSLNIVQFVLTQDFMNEATKLQYLQLFYSYGLDLNITISINYSENQAISRYFSILEFSIEKQYLNIFNWILKSKIPTANKDKNSLLARAFVNPKNRIAKAIIDKKTPLRTSIGVNDTINNDGEILFNKFLWNYITSLRTGIDDYENDILRLKCDFLLKHGYDINNVNKNGQSILHVAVLNIFLIESDKRSPISSKVIIDFLKYLIDNTDININLRDNEGNRAYDLIDKIESIDKFKKKMILSLFSL